MARVKKAIDYINDMCLSVKASNRVLGKTLQLKYEQWAKTLALKDFLDFNNSIMENKAEIGVAQFFGKFRAYAFEEYVYRLLKERVRINDNLKLFWGDKCIVWGKNSERYAMEFDISIGKKIDGFVEPTIVFDTKIELDSARLKTALASFVMLKSWKPKAKCVLVYVMRDLDETLLRLAKNWTDAVFQFSLENDETEVFVEYVARCLR